MSVSQNGTVIRPAVAIALLVQSAHSFTGVLQRALEFQDTHVFDEPRIVDLLLSDMDVALKNDVGEDLRVAVGTTVGVALLFGRFISIFFKIASDMYKVHFVLMLMCCFDVLCCAVLLCCAVHVLLLRLLRSASAAAAPICCCCSMFRIPC